MILYKNVDLCDLQAIAENGILSMDDCKNDNWVSGLRSNNSTQEVYLFSPLGNQNSFPNYGVALLEVDCAAKIHIMSEYDAYKDIYDEYITSKVLQSEIKRVIIPKIFKDYITVPQGVNITWCGLGADRWEHGGLTACSKEFILQFAKTAPLMDSTHFNFFRGIEESGEIIDLYNIRYIF